MKYLRIYSLYIAVILSPVTGCFARDFGAFNFFRGVIEAARVDEAREAWAAVPQADRTCLTRALESRNTDIPTLIGSGILPGDRRLRSFVAQCRGPDATALRREFACDLADESGRAFSTMCNQSFAKEDAEGHPVPVSPQEAADLRLAGTRVIFTNVETNEAKQQRHERAEAQARAERLRTVQGELDQYRYSTSPVIRSRFAKLRAQIERQLSGPSGPEPQLVEELAGEVKALHGLSEFEASRLSATRHLSELRAKAEGETKSDSPPGFKARLQLLRQRFAQVSHTEKPMMTDQAIGPAFDCTKAETTLPKLICNDRALRVLDVEVTRPFYLLRQLFPSATSNLDKEADELSRRTLTSCRLPASGKAVAGAAKKLSLCIAATYRRQKQVWDARVERGASLPAREELHRPLAQHVRLQGYLRDAGVLPGDAVADGVYGSVTRRAIVAFEQAEGLLTDGLMSDALAERLTQRFAQGVVSAGDPALIEQITSLSADYETYIADLASAERELGARAEARAHLKERRAFVERLLAEPIPADLRRKLTEALSQMRVGLAGDPVAALSAVDEKLAELKSRTDEAEQTLRAVSKTNRFLFYGDPQDILVLYDSRFNASGVARGYNGKLVFDVDKTYICSLQPSAFDRIELQLVQAALKSFGAPTRQAIATCRNLDQPVPDILILRRGQLPEQLDSLTKLASAVTSGSLSSLGTVSAEDVRTTRTTEAAKVTQVEAKIAEGTAEGLSLIALDNGSSTICGIIDGDKELYSRLLQPFKEQLTIELKGEPKLSETSTEYAFLSSKRRQCGAIYGNGRDLGKFAQALLRDNVKFRYMPIWIAPETASGAPPNPAKGGEAGASQRTPSATRTGNAGTMPRADALETNGFVGSSGDQANGQDHRTDEGRRAAVQPDAKVAPAAAAAIRTQGESAPRPSAPPSTAREKRVALVIGNSTYRNVPFLANPVRDANNIAAVLRSDGFEVISKDNLTHEQLINVLASFTSTAETADWAVVYFAGHGIEIGGINYLIPIDAKLVLSRIVRYETVPLDDVKEAVAGARKLRLVIVDACRANPFANQMRRDSSTRALTRGLARPPEPEPGTMIFYAAKEGEVALDGSDSAGSPFANALVKQLRRPGVEVRRLLDNVRDDVWETTAHNQLPYHYGGLPGTEDFYFRAAK